MVPEERRGRMVEIVIRTFNPYLAVAITLFGMMLATIYSCPASQPVNGKQLFGVLAAGGYSLVIYFAVVGVAFGWRLSP
jgi:hypothetical protein